MLPSLGTRLSAGLPAILLAVMLRVVFGKVPGDSRWASDLSNFFHGPAFAAVTLLLVGLRQRQEASRGRIALAAAGFIAAQDRRLRPLPHGTAVRVAAVGVCVLSSILMLAPIVTTAAAYLQRARGFPVLVDFDSPVSTCFVRGYGG